MTSTRQLALLCLPLIAFAGLGCSSQYPTLTFRSVEQRGTLTQPYAISAMSRDGAGDWNVVLVSQGLESPRPFINRVGTALNPAEMWNAENPAGKDLTPTASPPVRQVIHMTLRWKPSRGAKANNPAAANATIRWLIFGSSTPPVAGGADAGVRDVPPDLIEYQGTVFVRPFFEDKGYTLLVQEGTLRRTLLRGEMVDVLGPTIVEGKFYVPDDPATVANVLSELPPPTPAEAVPSPSRTPSTRTTTRPARRR